MNRIILHLLLACVTIPTLAANAHPNGIETIYPDGIENLEFRGPIEKNEEIIFEILDNSSLDYLQRSEFERSQLVQSYIRRLNNLLQTWIVNNFMSKTVKDGRVYYIISNSYESLIPDLWNMRGYIEYEINNSKSIGLGNIIRGYYARIPIIDGLLIAFNSKNQPEYAKRIRKKLEEDSDYELRVIKLLEGKSIDECASIDEYFFDINLAKELIKGVLVKRIINATEDSKMSFEERHLIIGESANFLQHLDDHCNESTFNDLMKYVFKYSMSPSLATAGITNALEM